MLDLLLSLVFALGEEAGTAPTIIRDEWGEVDGEEDDNELYGDEEDVEDCVDGM